MTALPRAKKCRACPERFVPRNSMQVACSPACALELAKAKREQDERKHNRAALERIKTRAELLVETQKAFNAWIRARDAKLPCVSCGRPNDGHHQRHAGHYRSTGSTPELRFHPANCHAQCATCNNHLSGNLIGYRQTLLTRIGPDQVAWLEGPHEAAKFSKEELLVMKANFKQLAKEAGRDIR